MTSSKQYSAGSVLLQTLDYAYDVYGNVVSRTLNWTTTNFTWEITNNSPGITTSVHTLWAELDTSGNVTTRYFNANGTASARSNGSTAYWLLADRLGCTGEITNTAGVIVDEFTYSLFQARKHGDRIMLLTLPTLILLNALCPDSNAKVIRPAFVIRGYNASVDVLECHMPTTQKEHNSVMNKLLANNTLSIDIEQYVVVYILAPKKLLQADMSVEVKRRATGDIDILYSCNTISNVVYGLNSDISRSLFAAIAFRAADVKGRKIRVYQTDDISLGTGVIRYTLERKNAK